MTESGRRKGSVISFSLNGRKPKSKNGEQMRKRNKGTFRIGIIGCIAGAAGFIFCLIFANIKGCTKDYYGWFADELLQIFAGGGVVGFISGIIESKRNSGLSKREVCRNSILTGIAVSLLFLDISSLFKIAGFTEEEELKQQEESVSAPGGGEVAENYGRAETQVGGILITYDIEQDPFVENHPLEVYFGEKVSESEQERKIAELLLRDLELNKPGEAKSWNYVQLTETADIEYNSYKKFKEQEENTEAGNKKGWLFEDSMEMLQKSLDKREEADKECKTPDNQRPLAAGYKEKGDAYVRKGNQNTAIENYEKGAAYYMKAIYYAAALDDREEIEECMKQFIKLGEEVEKLGEISEERRERILRMIRIYEKFVELYSE